MNVRHVVLVLCCILLLPATATVVSQQQDESSACKFTIHESNAKPTVAGPDEVVSRVHVIDQPDSPIEFVAIDFTGSWLAVGNNREADQLRCKLRIRNRSDRAVTGFEGSVWNVGAGFVRTPGRWPALRPGQEVEINGCGGGGSGTLPDNNLRLLVGVSWVAFEQCDLYPCMRVPHSLGPPRIRPAWRIP